MNYQLAISQCQFVLLSVETTGNFPETDDLKHISATRLKNNEYEEETFSRAVLGYEGEQLDELLASFCDFIGSPEKNLLVAEDIVVLRVFLTTLFRRSSSIVSPPHLIVDALKFGRSLDHFPEHIKNMDASKPMSNLFQIAAPTRLTFI